jgi:hypothetical protein
VSADYLRQQMIEITQAAESYHAERVAELNAEVKRLRDNITELQTYAEGRAAKYEEAGVKGAPLADYFLGKAEAYDDMVRMACVAYAVVSSTERKAEVLTNVLAEELEV